MKKVILTPKIAQKIQDEIFRKMTAEKKIKIVSQFFKFGKKLNKLNNKRLDGNRRPSCKNIRDIKTA